MRAALPGVNDVASNTIAKSNNLSTIKTMIHHQ